MSDFHEHFRHMSPERRNYTLRALTAHFEQSGESVKLHRLLRENECTEETTTEPQRGRNRFRRLFTGQRSVTRTKCLNSWFSLQEQENESAAFIADVNRGWKLAEADAAAELRIDGKARSIAFAARYALILSSINDIGSGMAPSLIARLIGASIWTLTQGRTYARQVPAMSRRALSLAAVASQTSGSVKHEILTQAVKAVLSIKDSGKRAGALVNLAPQLCQPLLRQLLKAAREINYADYGAQALIGIIPHLSEPVRSEAVKEASVIIQKIDDQQTRAKAVASMAPHLLVPDAEEGMRYVLATVRALPYDMSKAELMADVAPHLPESLLPNALDVAREIGIVDRGKAILPLASRLAEFGRQKEAMQLMHSEASIHSENSLAGELVRMAPHLNEEQLREALKLVGKLYVAETRAAALVGLAPHLPEKLFRKAFTIVESMKHAVHKVEPLAALLRELPEEKSKEELEPILLTAMREYETQAARLDALERMAPNIPEELLPVILSESRRIDDEKRQVKVLTKIAAVLPPHEKAQASRRALSKARGIDRARDRFEALAWLTSLIAETTGVDEALEVALAIEHPDHCAWGLTGVFPHLTHDAREDVVLGLMNDWRKTQHEEMLPNAFNHLAPYLLSDAIWRKAVSFAQEKEWISCRGGILASLLRHVINAERLSVLLPLALSITEATTRSAILSESARQLVRFDSPEEALELARGTTDEMQKVDILEAIVSELPGPLLPQVTTLVEELTFDGKRWSVIATLAPRFVALGEWDVAVQLMTSIKMYHRQALAAARMAEHASGDNRERLVEHALAIVRNAQGEFEESEDWWQGETLTRLAPYLPGSKLEEAIELTLNIVDPDTRADALRAMTTEWLRLKPTDIYRLWEKCLQSSSGSSRIDLLENLLALTPVINHLGGPETATEIVEAINDVGEWWPA